MHPVCKILLQKNYQLEWTNSYRGQNKSLYTSFHLFFAFKQLLREATINKVWQIIKDIDSVAKTYLKFHIRK